MENKHAIIQKKGHEKMVILISHFEKPLREDSLNDAEYEDMINDWESSFMVFPVREEGCWLNLAHEIVNGNEKHLNLIERRNSALYDGVSIDPKRVSIVEVGTLAPIADYVELLPISNEDEIQSTAERIQEESHNLVEFIISKNSNIGYQDAMNIFLFRKLAELEIQLKNK